MEFQLSYFKSWKMMLWKCCTQCASKFGRLSSGHRTGKRSVFIPIPKKGNAKARSNYHTTALISYASKVMLRNLQARFQQYKNWELPGVQAEFWRGRGTRDQIANIYWIMEKESESEHRSVVSGSLWPHGLYSPWNSPGQNTGVASLSLLLWIFPTQGLNPALSHCRNSLYLQHRPTY